MNKYMKLFFHRIVKDLKQKELLPLKLLFFMHSSTILVLYPYLTIHMRELGISVEETAIMSSVTPVVAILMPPVAGMIADKIGNFRVMLASFSVIGGASALLFLLVPIGRATLTLPNELIFGLSCSANSPPILSLHQEHPCFPISNSTIESEFHLKSCGFACQAILEEKYIKIIAETKEYGVRIHDIEQNSSTTYTYTLKDDDVHYSVSVLKINNHMKLKNNERYTTSIRKLSKNVYYFPTRNFLNFSCDVGRSPHGECVTGNLEQILGFSRRINSDWRVGLSPKAIQHDDILEERQLYKIDHIDSKAINNITCLESRLLAKKHISLTIPVNSTDPIQKVTHIDLGSCSPKCIGNIPRRDICSNPKQVVEVDMSVTFWSYLCIRVFVGIVSGTSFAMFEGAVIAILREHKADYGLQRIYATIGGMMSSPLAGFLVDFASRGKSFTDFRPIFFLYAALKIISGILMLFINLEFKKAADSVISNVIEVLKKTEMIALFISCLILGCAWGFIENFLFWFLEDLGGSKSLMGLTITVGGVVGIPLLVLSGPLIKKLGHANIIFIGFIFYAIRLFGYSIIYNPWLCLIFEAMESITFGLSFTAAVTYAAKLSTVTTDTSIQGMLGGLYYGVGKGLGSLFGGYLIKPIGIRSTFQLFAVCTTVTGIIYIAFYHLYMKKRPSEGTDIIKKNVSEKCPPENNVSKVPEKISHQEVATGYEDSLCNPAFESTEENFNDLQDEKEQKNKPVV